MSGGPSQIDTFDPKPGHANGGPFKPIQTSVPGILIGEHLPKIAREAKELAIIRGMSTKEGDHSRATYNLRTGYLPQGPVRYPTLGSLVSKELEDESAELPGFVSIAPYRAISPGAFGSGFLGPRYAPLIVGERANGAPARAAGRSGWMTWSSRPKSSAIGPTTGWGLCSRSLGTSRKLAQGSLPQATRTPTCGRSK